jgi:hypothetical protein
MKNSSFNKDINTSQYKNIPISISLLHEMEYNNLNIYDKSKVTKDKRRSNTESRSDNLKNHKIR